MQNMFRSPQCPVVDVGRYFDQERINQGQRGGALVLAESVQCGLADPFGPWIPGLRWA